MRVETESRVGVTYTVGRTFDIPRTTGRESRDVYAGRMRSECHETVSHRRHSFKFNIPEN